MSMGPLLPAKISIIILLIVLNDNLGKLCQDFGWGSMSRYINSESLSLGHPITFSFKTELHFQIHSTLKNIQLVYLCLYKECTISAAFSVLQLRLNLLFWCDFLLIINDNLKASLWIFAYQIFKSATELGVSRTPESVSQEFTFQQKLLIFLFPVSVCCLKLLQINSN